MRTSASPASARYEWFIALGLTVILVGLHLVLLFNRGPLWRDEISSLTLATQPTLARFWAGLALDPFPAFFFLLLRAWHALAGGSDFALRVFGFLVGLACLGVFWWNARLTGRRTPIFLLLLLGFSPNFIIWGDSLRAYGVGILLALLLFGLLWQLTQRLTGGRFAAAALVAVLGVQTQYTNSLLVFACAMGASAVTLRHRNWRGTMAILAVGAIAALSLLPYLTVFQRLQSWATLGRVNFSLQNSLYMLYVALLGAQRPLFWLWVVLLAAALGSALWWQRRTSAPEAGDTRRDLALYGLVCAVLAFLGTMGFYRAVGWGTNVWYYLPMLALMAAGIDLILSLVRFSWAPLARGGIGLLGVAALAPVVFATVETRSSNIDLIAKIVSERAAPDDLVVVWPSADGITFQRYVGKNVRWVAIPDSPNLPPQPDDDVMQPYRERDSLQPTLARVRQTLHAGHQVWVASTWELRPYEGGAPPVEPLTPTFRPTLGYYLRGWGFQLVDELKAHATKISRVKVEYDQPISPYERSALTVFSREKEAAD